MTMIAINEEMVAPGFVMEIDICEPKVFEKIRNILKLVNSNNVEIKSIKSADFSTVCIPELVKELDKMNIK